MRPRFGSSLNLDEATKRGQERENRWDYLLGDRPSDTIVAIEPHSADDSEIERVIRKKKSSQAVLAEHLGHGARVAAWIWVASKKVRFLRLERAMLRLQQSGVTFAGTAVAEKHLPPPKRRR